MAPGSSRGKEWLALNWALGRALGTLLSHAAPSAARAASESCTCYWEFLTTNSQGISGGINPALLKSPGLIITADNTECLCLCQLWCHFSTDF